MGEATGSEWKPCAPDAPSSQHILPDMKELLAITGTGSQTCIGSSVPFNIVSYAEGATQL